jgi:hypothetical protein
MSKKIVALFIILVVALAIATTCALYPPASAAFYEVGVNVLGRGFINLVTGIMTGMMAWGATSLGPAMVIALGWSIGAIIFWTIILNKYIWKRYIKKEEKPDQSKTFVPQVAPVAPETAPREISAREVVKPEQEAVAS